jgi:ABC-2 type transport system ATP-binding protein
MQIEIKQLNQYYGKNQVLHDINLTIPTGMYGLLGRNGAGKSTLMKTLVTLLPVKDGHIQMAGIPIHKQKEVRSIVGYLPQDFSMYKNMSAYDAMDYLAVLSGLERGKRKNRIIALLDQVNLTAHKNTKVKAMSGGMRRRLGIAQALLHEPKILIVDEPTAGLDPEERLRFRNLLSEISQDKIVLLSTHIASDIEESTDKLAILDEGKIIFDGDIVNLLQKAEGHIFSLQIPCVELEALKKQVQIISIQTEGAHIKVRFISNSNAQIMNHPLIVNEQPRLEDAYLYCLSKQGGSNHDLMA